MSKNLPIYAVYTITNTATGRQYYGMTHDTEYRWEYHVGYLRYGRHSNKALQADWKLFDESDFKFEIVLDGLYKDEADSHETQLIRADDGCYNIRKRADGRSCVTRTGARRARTTRRGSPFFPLLSRKQALEILALKGTDKGYKIAERFGVSPSLVSQIFTGKYASGFSTFAD